METGDRVSHVMANPASFACQNNEVSKNVWDGIDYNIKMSMHLHANSYDWGVKSLACSCMCFFCNCHCNCGESDLSCSGIVVAIKAKIVFLLVGLTTTNDLGSNQFYK